MKKVYYTNGITSIKIHPDEIPPEGFWRGRTFNVNTWNKGKTKEDDPRIAANVANMAKTRKENGSYENPWNKGLTKETDSRLQVVSDKVSVAMQGKEPWNKGVPATEEQKQKQSVAMKGTTPYNKGLTKENCDSLLSASNKLKGHKCYVTDWSSAKQKEYETKKRNNSFNTSKPEEEYYSELLKIYTPDDIVRQYRDKRYPFNCDFYIKSKDLFIELQYSWCHNVKPFDDNDLNCVTELNSWIEKSKTSDYYKYAIYIWTDLDVRKLKTARESKLNFMFVYPNNLVVKD